MILNFLFLKNICGIFKHEFFVDTGQGRALIRLYTLCMDTGQGRSLIRLYPLYGYWTGQGTDKAIPSVWILDRAGH